MQLDTKTQARDTLEAVFKEGLYIAQDQAARDGAVIVNHLYDLYNACGREPSSVDICHFSLVADLQYSKI